ncbi:hypothetical protein PGQ11_005737 [Apiospora arundinis]|uniref:Uncharacterized protein n=1 Tax=Apiospora arundinis TaxID=335852 RepID=A0ABR2JCB5_9PEZI
MSPSEPEVLAALAAYRSHISSLNHRAFCAMIPEIEAAGLDNPDHFESKEKREARLDFLLSVVGAERGGTSPPMTRPSDLLTHWESLAPQLALDGASVCPDSVWRGEIAGGWACGDKGNEATCYVVYSRLRDGGEEEEEVKEQSWSWRYVATLGQFGEEVFEDVIGMLEWYKSYDEPEEQDWEVLPGEVLGR